MRQSGQRPGGRATRADLARAAVLIRTASRLARVDTPDDVLQMLATDAVHAFGARSISAVITAPGGPGFLAVAGDGVRLTRNDRIARLDPESPVAAVMRDRSPGRPVPAGPLVLPILVDDRTLGAIEIDTDDPELDFLSALIAQFAQAWDRTVARADADRAHVQLQALNDLSGRLGSAAEPAQVFRALLDTVVPRLARGVLIHYPGSDKVPSLIAGTHADRLRWQSLEAAVNGDPAHPQTTATIGEVLRSGASAITTVDTESWLVSPMQDGVDRLGVLTLVRDAAQPFTDRDIPFASEWSHRAAVALARIRDAQRLRRVADELQSGLLPRRLPAVAGLSLAGRYRPGRRDLQVGGDFYDVFRTGGDRLSVVIGDVCGTGPVAASRTALVRHSTRAFARVLTGPDQICAAASEALLQQEELNGAFCSMAYASLRTGGDRITVDLVLAGHPRPLLRHADGRVCEIGTSGTVLGVVRDVAYTVTRHHLTPGETLLFYTDGASERRHGDRFLAADGLRDLLAEAPAGSAEELLDHLMERILGFSDQPLADDLALVAVHSE
ncbi:Phosphoserine phosphatase rsbU [Actinoplanes sp. SE50]|uniref:GAF domain-containing SpoIIE family protein phosphatase n=1 Tax=unclassified Actinoplanes TaxID=2626549 RepID=UPI00023ECB2C|nr:MULTISPECIES: PP2C family protein-serine/threonine phosphatase [unclassified Actinoplanes]AEV84789.1 Phosphoserine phosphatase rsbU [Actinoplanes sp. SE50/110]ATO83181.1 Phosphoserine phosphatase rsbU [Actinoplanes sp. SE50]SLM00588.1 hypothetical protein ACSP50_3821 [Actinoplanes sp. SE50/110]